MRVPWSQLVLALGLGLSAATLGPTAEVSNLNPPKQYSLALGDSVASRLTSSGRIPTYQGPLYVYGQQVGVVATTGMGARGGKGVTGSGLISLPPAALHFYFHGQPVGVVATTGMGARGGKGVTGSGAA